MPGMIARLASMALAWLAFSPAHAQSVGAAVACGNVISVATHESSTTRYALVAPPAGAAQPVTLALLAGGSGALMLDERGCPRALKGNSLVRSVPLFSAQGFGTALVDAPSDRQGDDGLAGFRTSAVHGDDLGRIVADLRARTGGAVWLIGTSRGTISAANAGSRLAGDQAPDGIVLTSVLTSGDASARRAWVAQTVFDLPLEKIEVPLLVVGHRADICVRSPPGLMGQVAARSKSRRRQVVLVSGGPQYSGPGGIHACEGRSPHGFIDQEAEVADGIARFVRGGEY